MKEQTELKSLKDRVAELTEGLKRIGESLLTEASDTIFMNGGKLAPTMFDFIQDLLDPNDNQLELLEERMKTIHKYPISIRTEQQIELPYGYKPICVQIQNGKIWLWAKVNSENHKEYATIFVIGTGQYLPGGKYIGTVQLDGYVWHIYHE